MKKTLISALFFILWSCNDNAQPAQLLSKEQMSHIIADMALYGQNPMGQQDFNIDESNHFIFKKHQTTPEIFKESYVYYIYDPENVEEIFINAKKVILQKSPSLEAKIKEQQQKNQTK